MTLLEGRGGGGGGGGDGPEVTTMTARFHSGNGQNAAVKQKMMDTTPSTVQDEPPYLLHLSHQQHRQQQLHQQQQQQQRPVGSSFANVRGVTSPQRVPEMLQSTSHNVCENTDRRQQQHELKNWSEVSTVLLQQTSVDAKDERHSLAADDDSYNDRNNNNQMNF